MTKHLLTALLASVATSAGLYAIQPTSAAVPPAPARPASPAISPAPLDLAMPPPQEPLDMTPITPYESAGAPYEL
jgi:hypothetical protein